MIELVGALDSTFIQAKFLWKLCFVNGKVNRFSRDYQIPISGYRYAIMELSGNAQNENFFFDFRNQRNL